MSASYIGAIDQGTSSTRFIVFDRQGGVVSSAQKEHRQICPQPGWVEHDAEEILRNTREVAAMALARAGLNASDLAAVGIANQRETTVLWERDSGRPVHAALVWMDTRTEPMVEEWAAEGGRDRFREQTGLPLSTYFSALKLRWLLDQLPNVRQRAEQGDILFGTMDSWLAWNLTGGAAGGLHVSDVSNASRTQLMNIHTCEWDADLLRIFGIPAACLPRIVSSSAVVGEITLEPLAGVPLAGLLGDQQAALVGQACFETGEAKNTYGTGAFLLLNTGTEAVVSRAGLLTTVAYRFGEEAPRYALEGAIAITGAAVQWLRDNLGLIRQAADIEALAAEVDDNGDVYFVPAFSGLYAPYWRDDARGLIMGLTRYSNRSHLARAVLEAAAYQVRDVAEAMRVDSGIDLRHLKADGGMAANGLLMQFQADMLDRPVIRPRLLETTALGAAYAAGLGVGLWADTQMLRDHWIAEHVWEPALGAERREHYYARWKQAVNRAFGWI